MKRSFAWLAILLISPVLAQPHSAVYQSAIIKPSEDPDGRAGYNTAPGKLTLINQTLKDCVRLAFELDAARAPNAPKWIDTEHFDIEVDAGHPVEDPEMKAALRAILETRFHLALHRESKMLAGYALVVAKSGLKMQEDKPGAGRIRTRPGSVIGEAASMANLAQSLAVILNAPVVDLTDARGLFDFRLDWTPSVVQPGSLTADDDERNVLPDPPGGPTLFSAIEQQLGLKLEPRKVRREVLWIDRATRPE